MGEEGLHVCRTADVHVSSGLFLHPWFGPKALRQSSLHRGLLRAVS